MDEFIFSFARIVRISAWVISVLLAALGVILLWSPTLLMIALRIIIGLLCLLSSAILLIRLVRSI